jgi:hypothetical protein
MTRPARERRSRGRREDRAPRGLGAARFGGCEVWGLRGLGAARFGRSGARTLPGAGPLHPGAPVWDPPGLVGTARAARGTDGGGGRAPGRRCRWAAAALGAAAALAGCRGAGEKDESPACGAPIRGRDDGTASTRPLGPGPAGWPMAAAGTALGRGRRLDPPTAMRARGRWVRARGGPWPQGRRRAAPARTSPVRAGAFRSSTRSRARHPASMHATRAGAVDPAADRHGVAQPTAISVPLRLCGSLFEPESPG